MKQYKITPPQKIKEGEIVRRSFVCDNIKALDKENRLIDFTISTASVDRYGDIVTVSGWDLKAYKKNPIVLFGHNSRIPPIGRATKVWKESDALRATAQFMSEDLSSFAYSIFRMFEEKFLRAVSVGFIPTQYEPILDKEGEWTGGFKFLKQELLEFSAVPIPANPEAIMDAKAAGIDVTPFKDWAEKMLDDWGNEADPLKEIYGVGRREVENLRKKAGSAVYQVPLDIQDELRQRNLEAAKKYRQEQEEKTVAEETDEFTTIKIGDAEHTLSLLSHDHFKDLRALTISKEEINGEKSLYIEDAPEKSAFSLEYINDALTGKDLDDDLVSLDGTKLTFKGADSSVAYEIIGIDKDGETLIGELVETEDKETTSEEQSPPEVEATATETEEEGQTESETEVEASGEDEPTAVVEEPSEEDKELGYADEPASFEDQVASFDWTLQSFEEALDKRLENGYPSARHVTRKMEFLAGYMRELADKLDPRKEGESETTKTVTTTTPTRKEGTFDVTKAVAEKTESIKSVIEAVVARELRKAKGHLD